MNLLTLVGLFAAVAMLVCYALEARTHWFTLGFAVACLLGAGYCFAAGAWPFGAVEAIWSLVIVVSIKYVGIIMRADNQGEGGILALLAMSLNGTEPSAAGGASSPIRVGQTA